MKILITGSSGFFGSKIANYFSKQGDEVFSLNHDRGDYKYNLAFEIPVFDQDFDMIIHCAGKAHSAPKSLKEKEEFFHINLNGTKNLCAALEGMPNKPKSFIFISTVAVYGATEGEGITEESRLKGKDPYAKSKIQAEMFLSEWTEKNNVILGILRPPLIVGPNPPGNLGAMLNGIKTGKYLSIGKADAKKSMVWIEDIPSIISKIAKIGGVYHLTDGHHPTFGELEKEIAFHLNKKKPISIPLWLAYILASVGNLLGEKAPINTKKLKKITSSLTFDDSKARNKLGWQSTKVMDKIHEIIS
jgi:nucleoside-diphosphate-sugar epimerase